MSAREWLARLRDRLRREDLDADLREELAFHRQQLERDGRAGHLGNETRVREDARDRWSFRWLDALEQDTRYALRGLRMAPGFTLTVALTLGLGIGANAAMFGVIDRLMFRPFAYLSAPSRVHRVYLVSQDRGQVRYESGAEYTRYLDLRHGTTSFDLTAAISEADMPIGEGQESREQRVARVSADLFRFFDAPPALGRYFDASEDTTPRGAPVAVLGYGFWKTELGGRNVLGTTLEIGNIPATIIGVAPRGFTGINDGAEPAAYLPITTYAAYSANSVKDPTNYFLHYNWGFLHVVARRKPGVSVAAASADLTQAFVRSWNQELALDYHGGPPVTVAKPHAIAGPLRTPAGPDAGLEARTLLWVGGVALIVLLIACANVANLLFARMLRRRREIAVRLALGVSRGRLVMQGLIESLVLAGLGCVAGVLVAQWGGAGLRALVVKDAPLGVITDVRTMVVACAIALLAGLLTGLWPAVQAGGGDLTADLKAGVREGGPRRSRTRSVLLVVQTALSMILLVGATLFVRSLDHVRTVRMGYDVEPLLMVSTNLRGVQLDSTTTVLLRDRMLEAAQSVPGVTHAAIMTSVPFWSTSSTGLYVQGIDSVRRLGRFTYAAATADYFATTGTRILRGRAFTDADRRGAPLVAVVSESMARKLWPGKDALGECMRVGSDTLPCTTVIGIAEDAMQNSVIDDAALRYYLPQAQFRNAPGLYLMARVAGEHPSRGAEALRAAIQRVMPGQSYVTVRPFSELVGDQQRPWQLGATMFAAFGVLALVVAAVGLYGVIGFAVTQRMHELGVRIALGARAGDILQLVLGQGMGFVAGGVVIGSVVALWAARFVQPLLYRQSARDPGVFGLVLVVLLGAGLLACLAPARRAVRADPNTALRAD